MTLIEHWLKKNIKRNGKFTVRRLFNKPEKKIKYILKVRVIGLINDFTINITKVNLKTSFISNECYVKYY